jgi:hypothetical protein
MKRRQNWLKNSSAFKRMLASLSLTLVLALGAPSVPFETNLFRGAVLAQGTVFAEVDRTQMALDEQVTLVIVADGAGQNFSSPDLSALSDFFVVGSSTTTQVAIRNGQGSAQATFIYRLRPRRLGTLVIDPITVRISGQSYRTDAIEIEVSGPQSAPTQPAPETLGPEQPTSLVGQDYFVEAEVDNPTPYRGQQITYTFRIYQAVDFRFRPDYSRPPFTNFWSQSLLSEDTSNVTAANRTYRVSERRTALFPATPGPITIPPATLATRGGLFDQDIVLETQPVTIQVKPLPAGAPEDFGGAVGQFEIQASLSQIEGTAGEPLMLIIEIGGSGNVETIAEPTLPELPGWRFFGSTASSSTNRAGELISGRRRFERLIVPGQAGNYVFPSIKFSYFDPGAEEYRTVSSEPIPVAVRPEAAGGASPGSANGDGSGDAVPLTDIGPIKPVPSELGTASVPLASTPVFWVGWIAPVLAVGGLWIRQDRRRRIEADTAYGRHFRANQTARRILLEAEQPGADQNAVVQRALNIYLSYKLDQPVAGLTADNLTRVLRSADISSELIRRIENVRTQTDIGRFAPAAALPGSDQPHLVEVSHLLDDLEKFLGAEKR